MNMTMQAVGIDSCVFQWSHEGSIFEALVGARPLEVDGQPTIKKAYEQEEKENV